MGKFDHKQYYQDNREEILWLRREKYVHNKKHREKLKKSSREYYRSKRGFPAERTIIVDDQGRKFFSIKHVSVAINREIQTIRRYHRQHVIPPPTHYDGRGWRLYTQDQLDILESAYSKVDRLDMPLGEVRDYLLERGWMDG